MAIRLGSAGISRSKSSNSVTSTGSSADQNQSQKSLACCCLVRATFNPGDGVTRRQCVIIDLGDKASKALQISCVPPLALLTENHDSNIVEWKLHIGCLGESLKQSVKLQLKLKGKNFSRCEACYVACEKRLDRPVNGHWSLFVLAQEFVNTILSKLRHFSVLFPLLPDLELNDLLISNRRFCMYHQTPEEGVAETEVAILRVNTTSDTVKSLETDVKAYKKTSLLTFQPISPDLTAATDASYFGSPIYCIDDQHSPNGAQFCLLGMVCSISQPKDGPPEADSVHLFASTISRIIHSAISGMLHFLPSSYYQYIMLQYISL